MRICGPADVVNSFPTIDHNPKDAGSCSSDCGSWEC